MQQRLSGGEPGPSEHRPSLRLHPAMRDREVRRIVELVATGFEVEQGSLLVSRRGTLRVARARQVAMYLTHVLLRRSLTEVGRLFLRDRTTVSHACGRIEDMRDGRSFEARIASIEASVEQFCEAVRHAA